MVTTVMGTRKKRATDNRSICAAQRVQKGFDHQLVFACPREVSHRHLDHRPDSGVGAAVQASAATWPASPAALYQRSRSAAVAVRSATAL
jgi:hypothetical protein